MEPLFGGTLLVSLPIMILLLFLLDAGIVYLVGKALGGQGSFSKAIYGVAAFSTPAIIIASMVLIIVSIIAAIFRGTTNEVPTEVLTRSSFILVLGGFIYLNYLNIILAQAIHGISLGKAFIVHSSVYILPTIMCWLIWTIANMAIRVWTSH